MTAETTPRYETALALVRPGGTSLPDAPTWSHMATIAKVLADSGMVPPHLKTMQAVLMVMLKARELGVPETMALTEISMIKGKPSCSAQLMLSLIQRDHGGDAIIFEETSAKLCRISYTRRGWGRRLEYEYTLEEAQTAGLVRKAIPPGGEPNNWDKFPKAMLRARCVSAVARMAFADTIGGMYLHEEVGLAVEIIEGEQVIEGTVEPAPAARGNARRTTTVHEPSPEALELAKLRAKIEAYRATDEVAVRSMESKRGRVGIWDRDTLITAENYLRGRVKSDAETAQGAQTPADSSTAELPAQASPASAPLEIPSEPTTYLAYLNDLLFTFAGQPTKSASDVQLAQAVIETGRRLLPGVVKVTAKSIATPKIQETLEQLHEAATIKWAEQLAQNEVIEGLADKSTEGAPPHEPPPF